MKQTAVKWLKDMLEWNYGDLKMLEISWVNLDDLFERAKQMEKEQIIEERKIYKRISDLPQFINPIETDKLMNIYLGQQAKKLFFGREIPMDSMGVFKSNIDEWVYWYRDERVYDTGFADTQAEAMQKSKAYIKIINLRYDI